MNERIKAIGRQAGFAFIGDGVYGQRWYSSKCGMDASEFEEFAELVAAAEREACIEILSRTEFTSLEHMPSEAALIIRTRGGE